MRYNCTINTNSFRVNSIKSWTRHLKRRYRQKSLVFPTTIFAILYINEGTVIRRVYQPRQSRFTFQTSSQCRETGPGFKAAQSAIFELKMFGNIFISFFNGNNIFSFLHYNYTRRIEIIMQNNLRPNQGFNLGLRKCKPFTPYQLHWFSPKEFNWQFRLNIYLMK